MSALKKLLLLISLIFMGVCAYFYYDARYLAVKRINIRYETIESSKIPLSFNNTEILFFSDIYYGEFMDEERLNLIIDQIITIQPDIVVFLGDLFADPINNPPSADSQSKVTELLSSIKAPLGKFAIYGDLDLSSQTIKQRFDQIMYDANFEILNDQIIKLTNNDSQAINLIAISNLVNSEPDLNAIFNSYDATGFNLLVSHTPDLIDKITKFNVEIMIAGHSLGGQINIPFYGQVIKMPYAINHYQGKTKVTFTLLDITNGLGTSRYDARLFSDPELVIYHFQSQ